MKSPVTYSLCPCKFSQNGNQPASCIIFADLGHSWTHCRLSGSILHKNPLAILFLVILHEPRIPSCVKNKTRTPKHAATMNMGFNSETLCVWIQYCTNPCHYDEVWSWIHVQWNYYHLCTNLSLYLHSIIIITKNSYHESHQTGNWQRCNFLFFMYAANL